MTAPGEMPSVAIACGGTGGHLFPGLTVAESLRAKNCSVTVFISPKEVDQKAVKNVSGMEIISLPAVALQEGNRFAFFPAFLQSFRRSQKYFRACPPQAALAMGGFTSAPPILAAKCLGARTFLHESNTVSGRANRLLARFVDEAFIGFGKTALTLKLSRITKTGTPVRAVFRAGNAEESRRALGLDPSRPVLLVMGGSQGASAINDLIMAGLPLFTKALPELQWFHLTGPDDLDKVRQAYAAAGVRALAYPFFEEMHVALGAATMAISRSGASSLAELAATLVPSVLIPFPAAAHNHQFYNAREFVDTGAALLLEQRTSSPETLLSGIISLSSDCQLRSKMQTSLRGWQTPGAADQIADTMLRAIQSSLSEARSTRESTGAGSATDCQRSILPSGQNEPATTLTTHWNS